jgi:acetoin utilization deacetylase AcuC-like enzyme
VSPSIVSGRVVATVTRRSRGRSFASTSPYLSATVEELALCHDREYVDFIRASSESGRTAMLDPDTLCTPSSYATARLAADLGMLAWLVLWVLVARVVAVVSVTSS